MQVAPPYSKNRTNPILQRDDVGKGKNTIYNLPKNDFSYGKPLARDREGAKEVTMTWNFHNESNDKIPSRDFTKLNKMSVQSGLYKSNNDARLNVKKGKNALPIELPEEEFRYGIQNRPSTPMRLVMGNSYGNDAEAITLDMYKYRSESQLKESKMFQDYSVRSNKASTLFSNANHKKLESIQGKQEKELFKLQKFKNVDPRTNTNLIKGNLNNNFNDKRAQAELESKLIKNNNRRIIINKLLLVIYLNLKSMLQYKKLLKENQNAILAILNKYKKHRANNQMISLSVDDFIQLVSRQRFSYTKTNELFEFLDKSTYSNKYIEELQFRSDNLENEINQIFNMASDEIKQFTNIKINSNDNLEKAIIQQLEDINKLILTPSFNEASTDLSKLCSDAYNNLMQMDKLSPIKDSKLKQINDPHPTPTSIDFSKLSLFQKNTQDQSISMIKCEGEWDSKLESDCDNSVIGEFEKVKQAIGILDKAKLLTAENMQALMKCTELNEIDKQVYIEFFLQVMKFKLKQTNQHCSSQIPGNNNNIPILDIKNNLREQVLQVPQQQDFSFESPLPSLRKPEEQAVPAQSRLKHVQLEDLLQIKSIEEQIMEEDNLQQTSPEQKKFNKKYFQPQIQNRVGKSTSVGNSLMSDGSFYSQNNLKNYQNLIQKKPRTRGVLKERKNLQKARSQSLEDQQYSYRQAIVYSSRN